MSVDRELLELAAKAGGVSLGMWNDGTEPYSSGVGFILSTGRFWNPLTDDGDALRLAVMLRIDIEPWIHGNDEFARCACQEALVDEPHGDDPYAATRRAIVRAAAEIGRAMK